MQRFRTQVMEEIYHFLSVYLGTYLHRHLGTC